MKEIPFNQLGDVMGWLGLDDTDHLGGGCTTFSMYKIIQNLPSKYKVKTHHLVRLYPLASRRTRGNAAVAIEIIGDDYHDLMEFLEQWWTSELLPMSGKITESEMSERKQSPTDPGMVWFEAKPDQEFYWNCVSREVELSSVPPATKSWGGHGRIGATAAIAWPALHYTFEAICWRSEASVASGQARIIDLVRLDDVDNDANTFMSRDIRTNSVLISPRGNCPVLFGIRALTYDSALVSCKHLITSKKTEKVEDYLVFKTNQATDDHLGKNSTAVVEEVTIKRRGSTKIRCTNGDELMAFAESGEVKLLAQWLLTGDEIEFNGLRNEHGTIHLEKLKVTRAEMVKRRPKCVNCDVTLKSMGKNQQLRCPKCRHQFDESWDFVTRTPPFPDWVQPPSDARRHLAKPLNW